MTCLCTGWLNLCGYDKAKCNKTNKEKHPNPSK